VGFVDANGLRFAYLSEGAGPLVLLLHGFPDTPHTFEHALHALRGAGYRAVAPFMRGYHPTAIPSDGAYDLETLGKDAIALIEALGARDAIVIGHDWGAGAAYTAASLSPVACGCSCDRLSHPRSLTLPEARLAGPRPSCFAASARPTRFAPTTSHTSTARAALVAGRDVPADTARVKAFRAPGSAGPHRIRRRLPPHARVAARPVTVPTVVRQRARPDLGANVREGA
jgi:pimeloyl-ACP methyl ester carboxylesterase